MFDINAPMLLVDGQFGWVQFRQISQWFAGLYSRLRESSYKFPL